MTVMTTISDAESLIDLAAAIMHRRSELLVPTGSHPGESDFARVRLALEFSRLPPEKRMVAMVEGWNLPRIVQEVY